MERAIRGTLSADETLTVRCRAVTIDSTGVVELKMRPYLQAQPRDYLGLGL